MNFKYLLCTYYVLILFMKIVNYSDFRKNLKTELDNVHAGESIKICRPLGKNAIVLSEEIYNKLLSNVVQNSSTNITKVPVRKGKPLSLKKKIN